MIRQLNEWDRPILFDYLQRNEEDTAFLLGNAGRYGIMNRGDILRCGDYFGYFEEGILKGVIAFYNMGTCAPHYESSGAVPYFVQLMIVGRYSMLIGRDRIIRPLYEATRHYKSLKKFEECSYCVNSNFKPFKLEGIEFLDVTGDNSTDILSFVRKAYLRGFEVERTIEGTKQLLSQKNEDEEFIILSKDNKLLAQACIQTATDSTSQIGAVYTLEEERGKGYGKAVVSELCERIRGKGKLPTLIVNKQNTPALDAYRALGFEHHDDYLIIRLYN